MKNVIRSLAPGSLLILLTSCSSSPKSLIPSGTLQAEAPKPALTSAEQCETTTAFKTIDSKDWVGGKIPLEWAASAAPECFGAGLPAIRVNDSRVSAFVQVVEMNGPANTDAHWAMNLNPSDTSQQYYLDVSPEARERMWPFYNLEYGPKILINPDFEAPLSVRRWTARLYGLALDQKTGVCTPIWGVEWSFTQKPRSKYAASTPPKSIPPREWKQDYGRIAPFSPNGCL